MNKINLKNSSLVYAIQRALYSTPTTVCHKFQPFPLEKNKSLFAFLLAYSYLFRKRGRHSRSKKTNHYLLFYSLIRIFVEKKKMEKTWTIRANEPVTLRMRKLQKGGYSLCIDISEISQLLTLIHDRMDEDEYEDDDGKSILLADYLANHKRECLATHRGNSYMHLCKNMENKLRGFLGKRYKTLHMDDIDTKMCRDFVTYLRGVRTWNGRLLSPVSVHHYFNAFKSLLNTAMKDEVIAHNPIDHMKRGEIPERPMVVRNFLDAAEVARLAATPCANEEVSRAFLFSCLTGLRISDIRQLTWNNFRKVGGEWYCHVVMQKTQEPLICKLTTAA